MNVFVPAIPVDQVAPGSAVRVIVDGIAVAIVHADDGFHAIADRCSHADVSLAEGEVVDCTIECWLHGSAFDLRTGAALTPPATRPVRVYATRISAEGVIEIDTSDNQEGQS